MRETNNSWRNFVAMMDQNKADARDRATAEINLELRRYSRRFKEIAFEAVDKAWADANQTGAPFDHRVVARDALKEVELQYGLVLGA